MAAVPQLIEFESTLYSAWVEPSSSDNKKLELESQNIMITRVAGVFVGFLRN